MKNLTKKLFLTAIIAMILLLVAIVCVGVYEIVLPTWGVLCMGGLALVALLSLVLVLIRLYNGAYELDDL